MENKKYTLIILSSANKNSVANKIFEKTTKTLENNSKEYKVIDLYKDNFKPEFEGFNLALYSRGQTKDENVIRYQKLLKEATEVIFIYKINLCFPETMMKGFLDKVLLSNGFWYTRKVAFFDALWGEMHWIKSSIALIYQDENKDFYRKTKKASKNQLSWGTMFALNMKKRKTCILFDSKNEHKQAQFMKKIDSVVGKEI